MSEKFWGRVLRGNKPEDFKTLSDNPSRRVVLLLPHEDLARINGLSDREKMIQIGWSEEEIRGYLAEGKQFKMVIFPANESIAKPATWENVIDTAARAYPDYPEIADKLRAQTDALEHIPLSEIERRAGYRLGDIDKKDSRYMSPENYAQSDGGLVATRSFLYHTLNLNSQFAGDGYTRTEDGAQGPQELIALNMRIADIPGAVMQDLAAEGLQELAREPDRIR